MRMYAGLDVGFKRAAVWVVDETGRIVWRGNVDTPPEVLERVPGSNVTQDASSIASSAAQSAKGDAARLSIVLQTSPAGTARHVVLGAPVPHRGLAAADLLRNEPPA